MATSIFIFAKVTYDHFFWQVSQPPLNSPDKNMFHLWSLSRTKLKQQCSCKAIFFLLFIRITITCQDSFDTNSHWMIPLGKTTLLSYYTYYFLNWMKAQEEKKNNKTKTKISGNKGHQKQG